MDLGTANSIIIHNDKIVVDQPSVVAIENKTDKLLAVGETAHQMEGKEPPGIRTIRPLRDGVIADFNAAEQMIRGMVKMVNNKRRWFSPALRMVGVPEKSGEISGPVPGFCGQFRHPRRARLKRTCRRPRCIYDIRAYGRRTWYRHRCRSS